MDAAQLNPQDMIANAERAEALLSVLANRHRLMIMCNLVEREMSVSELMEHSTLSQSALSQHLAKLRSVGLVTTRREGQSIFYSIDSEDARSLLERLYEIYCS